MKTRWLLAGAALALLGAIIWSVTGRERWERICQEWNTKEAE